MNGECLMREKVQISNLNALEISFELHETGNWTLDMNATNSKIAFYRFVFCMLLMQRTGLSSFCRVFALFLWQGIPWSVALSVMSGPTAPTAWCRTEIDYSAANDFVQSYYGDQISQPYFATPENKGTKVEPIYNGRVGFWDDRIQRFVPPTPSRCGFTLVQHAPTRVTDFGNLDQVRNIYLPELREHVIPKAFLDGTISDVIFWFPMYRREDQLTQGSSINHRVLATAPIAPLAHIDTDIGAYSQISEVVQLVAKNRIDDPYQAQYFDPKIVQDTLESGRRFAIVNFWRNANFQQPINRSPLALFASQYDHTKKEQRPCFPESRPDPRTSRWYTFPNMSADNECLVFCQYDRLLHQPSDIWHCALPSLPHGDNAVPRQSLDVRALVVFHEDVPPELDRFAADRMRPVISQSESEKFCTEQGQVEQRKARALVEKMK